MNREYADAVAEELFEDSQQESGDYSESEIDEETDGDLFVAGFSVNPFDYLAAAAQGVISKASSDLSSGEREAQEQLARYKAKLAAKEAKEKEAEEKREVRRAKMRRVKFKAKSWLDKAKENAVPIGVGIGGFALVFRLFKR